MRIFQSWNASKKSLMAVLALLLTFSTNGLAIQATDQIAPETGGSRTTRQEVTAQNFIITTAHPLASQAGYEVLAKGGNAIDAMVAVQTVLGLVEPQSSGLGGGAFLLYYDNKTHQLHSFDGRETAPMNVPENLFMSSDTTPMKFFEAIVGGRSVGTPGTVKLLWKMHLTRGNIPWADLLAPAIKLANDGFIVSPRLARAVKKDQEKLSRDNTTKLYFIPNGQALNVGQLLRNPHYANTLNLLAKHGGNYFYQKKFSTKLAQKVQNSSNPGYLSSKDFETYQVIERSPVCSNYRGYRICGMGPPSSGAFSVNATLGMLESFDLPSMSRHSPITWHYIAEASRLAFADRGLYIADPDFIEIPNGMLSSTYLKKRAKLIHPTQSSKKVRPGTPQDFKQNKYPSARSPEQASTTHFVIVDKNKNIVSMTSTIENGFGSRLMVNGFLLNNELSDFSFVSRKNGSLVANRVSPGKRPRSSMAPTIVFKGNKPILALGSPGGSRIINYVTNSLIAILDWKIPLQQAFDSPHIVNRFGTMDLEKNTDAIRLADDFKKMAYKTSIRDLNSGLHGVMFTEKGMVGAADGRREGQVLGH